MHGISAAVEEIASVATSLTPGQIADAESFSLEKRRLERMATYALVNENIAPGLLIGHRPDGSPYIIGVPDLRFSLTHSRRFAAIAWSDAVGDGIGIDVEEENDKLARVVSRFALPEEIALTGKVGFSLLLIWTIKEACYKAAGIEGLALTSIRVVSCRKTVADEVECEVVITSGETEGKRFTTLSCNIDDSTVITLARTSTA